MQLKVTSKLLLVLALLLTTTFNVLASDDSHSKSNTSIPEGKAQGEGEVKSYIQHHLKDAHDFTITHGVSFPLPVILWDNGLHVFMSSKFHDANHGTEAIVESKGSFYKLFHNKIYRTDIQGTITMDDHHHPVNVKPWDFSITKNVFSIFLMAIIMFLVFGGLARSYRKGAIPTGFGRLMEPIVLFIRDDIAIPNIGEKSYRKYMNYLLTVFFFIWFINLAGLTPLGVNVTGNIAVTFALALMTFLITQFTSKKDYWKHIFWMPGVPWPMKILLAPIELLGVIIKPFALMIRLFANMIAGHIVIMSLIGLMFWKFDVDNWFAKGAFSLLTLFLSVIELLVAALQAYIFTMLTALYFGMACEEHDEAHH